MKPNLFAICLCFITTLNGFSQDNVPKIDEKYPIPISSTEFIVQPLSVIGGGFELGIDHKFNLYNGFRFIVGIYGTESPTFYENSSSFFGYKLDAHYKMILDNRANKTGYSETYIGLYSSYRSISLTQLQEITAPNGSISTKEEDIEGTAASFGVLMGIKATLFKKLNVDLYGGVGYVQRLGEKAVSEEVHIPIVNPYQRGPMVKFGIAFGYLIRQKASPYKN